MTRHSIAIETMFDGRRWEYPNTPLGRLRFDIRQLVLSLRDIPHIIDRTNLPMRRIRP